MNMVPHSRHDSQQIGATAIRYLAQHGFEESTAGQLADAIGMSRSTFFRRFGSKDDVIFIDHEEAMLILRAELDEVTKTATPEAPTEVLTRSITGVFHHLTRDAEAAQLRSDLLRQTPALRDRELVMSNRYERLYVKYLQHALDPHTPEWVAHALGAGAVALHNATLRTWLRQPDPRIIASLDTDLRELCKRLLAPASTNNVATSPGVVIATFNPGVAADDVLAHLQTHLTAENRAHPRR